MIREEKVIDRKTWKRTEFLFKIVTFIFIDLGDFNIVILVKIKVCYKLEQFRESQTLAQCLRYKFPIFLYRVSGDEYSLGCSYIENAGIQTERNVADLS